MRWAASLVAASLVACSESLGPNEAIESVVVAPPSATVAVGANLALSAEVRATDGNVLANQRVSWASEDETIASVSAEGVVTGRKVGVVLIAASARGKDAFARVTVNPTPVASVRLSSTHRSMLVGQTEQLTAETLDGQGRVLPNRPVTWSSSDELIATVTPTGMVTALSPGGAIVTATSEGKSSVASITVSAVPVAEVNVSPVVNDLVVGQTTQLSAEVRDATGSPLSGRAITWTTNRPQVATVASDGLVSAIAPGSATITASSEGRSAAATVNVTPRPVSSIIVSPGQVSLFPGQNAQLSTMLTDDRGQVLTGRPVSFSSSNSQVATVSATGSVTAVSIGTATITATSEGTTGTATVTVSPEPVATVEVLPPSANVMVGQAVQLTATPRNAAGQALSGRVVTWTSGAPGLASVSSSGAVTGLAPGNAVIIASVDGKQGSSMVTVRQVPVASVSVTPSTMAVAVGQTVTLTATPRDAGGNALSGRVIGWSSSDQAIATVSNTGDVTGVSLGTVTISATSEGQTGTAIVTIALAPPAVVDVNPTQASLIVGQTVQLTATPRDAGGQAIVGRTTLWASATPGVATVSTSGVVTGVAAGSATITATVDGVVGSASVTVGVPGVATITVSPSSSTINVSATQTFSATARDGSGNVMNNAPITWSTSDPTVAAVSASGVVTGVSAGAATITAASGSATGSASVTVVAPVVATITVSPSSATINVSATRTYSATARDANGNVMSNAPITWSTSDPSVAVVSASGVVTGVSAGTATITAASGSVTGSASVTVQLAPVYRIVVTPTTPTIDPGVSVQMTATLYDAQDNVLTGRPVTWATSDASRVTVDQNGLATGVRKGSANISATSGGKKGETKVTVR